MSENNRHLRGDTNEVEVDVHGNVVVEKGDLLVIMSMASPFKTASSAQTTADWYAYPVSFLGDVSSEYYDAQFGGVAMKGSVSGTTEKIPLATTGIFRFPLLAAGGVTLGQLIAGATSAAAAASDQIVVSKTFAELTTAYYCLLGYCVKTEAASANVDFNLVTKFSGVSYKYMQAF